MSALMAGHEAYYQWCENGFEDYPTPPVDFTPEQVIDWEIGFDDAMDYYLYYQYGE